MSGAATALWRAREGHWVRRAAPEDAAGLAPVLRAADRAEIQAASGAPPLRALERCVTQSRRAYAAFRKESPPGGPPVLLFGVADHPLGPDVGAPWLLGSEETPRIARALLRAAPFWIARLGEGRRLLTNLADARNELHLAWLARLGFRRLRVARDCGPERRPFVEFARLAPRAADHLATEALPDV